MQKGKDKGFRFMKMDRGRKTNRVIQALDELLDLGGGLALKKLGMRKKFLSKKKLKYFL